MKNLSIFYFLLSCFLFFCQSFDTIELVGKTLEYQYGESIYHVIFDSDSTMHWKAMSGEESGLVANEIYQAEWIDGKRLFITWGEANGIGVSQVLDFKNGVVYNHLLRGREVSMGNGTIQWVK